MTNEQNSQTQTAYGQSPYGQSPYGQGQYDQGQYGQQPWGGQPGAGYGPQYADPTTEVRPDDRTWALISHVGSFVAAWAALGILCPILVLLGKSSRPYVRHHAYESLNFQLNALGWVAITSIVAVLTFGLGAVFYIPVGLWYFVFVCIATSRANAGEWYRYPLIIRVFNP